MPETPLAVPPHARRLHPVSLLVPVVRLARNGAVVVALLLFANRGTAIVLGALTLAGFLARCLQAYWTRYALDDVELTVWTGILNRTTRVASPARVQRVEVTRRLWHRLTGLAVVRVELAGSALESGRIELDALGLAEAERVRDALERGRRALAGTSGPTEGTVSEPTEGTVSEPPALVELSTGMLALGALTGTPILLVPPLLASGAFQLRELVGDTVDDAAAGATSVLVGAAWPVLVALGVGTVALWFAAATGLMVVRYHGYRLSAVGDDVLVRHGLLETRATVIPRRRVHLVDEHASFARRWLGLGALSVRTAAGDSRGRTVPVARQRALAGLPALLLGRDELPAHVEPHPAAAIRRAFVRRAAATIPAALIGSLGLTILTSPTGDLAVRGAAVVGAVVVARLWARAWHRRLGHAVGDGVLVVTEGVVFAHRRSVPLVRAQGVGVTQTPFQQRAGLCTVKVHLAGATSVRVPDVSAAQAMAIVAALPGLGPIDLARWAHRLQPAG